MASHPHSTTDGVTFPVKALMAGVAVALIASVGFWLYGSKTQAAEATAPAVAPTTAPSAVPVPPPTRSPSTAIPLEVLKKPVAATAKIDKRAALTSEFQSSKSLKAFYDEYASAAYANDGIAFYYRAKALQDCTSWHKIDPDKFASMFMPNYRGNPAPEVQLRVKAIFNYAERCAGFSEAADANLIKAMTDQALALNEPAAAAAKLLDIDKAGQHAEAESVARQLLQNPNPDIVNGILVYLGSREGGWSPGDFGHVSTEIRRDAWRLAACNWGADCGPAHFELRPACIVKGVCGSPSYVEYLQQHQYAPADFQRLQQLSNFIAHSVASRNWEALGLTTAHRRN